MEIPDKEIANWSPQERRLLEALATRAVLWAVLNEAEVGYELCREAEGLLRSSAKACLDFYEKQAGMNGPVAELVQSSRALIGLRRVVRDREAKEKAAREAKSG